MKRALLLLLAFLMLAGSLVGCKDKKAEETSEAGAASEGAPFALTKAILSEYAIVVAEGCDDAIKSTAEQMKKKLKDITGVEPKVKTDFVKEGSDIYFESEYEILFGMVNRAETNGFYDDVRENDGGYAMIGKKVLLVGRNADAIKKAYSMFLSDVLSQVDAKEQLLADGEEKIVVGKYDYDNMTLNGVGIQNYKIVYPTLFPLMERMIAGAMVAYIKKLTGYTLVAESDASAPSQYEIQIGRTNRITAASAAQEDQYVISPTDNGVWLCGVSTEALYSAANALYGLLKGNNGTAVLNEATSGNVQKLSVSVMTYNVLYNLSENRNPDHVLQSIETINADVFGCNEASEEWITRLTAKFSKDYTCVKGKIRSNDKSAEYCPIFFKTDKLELVENGTKWLSDTPDKMSKYKESHVYRIFSYAILRDKETGLEFMFISAHLENTQEGYDSKTARKKQSAVLKNFVDDYPYLPIIIAGDMNCTSLNDLSPLLSSSRFVNAPSIAKEKKESGTWVGKDFMSIGEGVLDYIFVSGDRVAVSKYEAVDNKIDGKYPSDHIPVRADVEIY